MIKLKEKKFKKDEKEKKMANKTPQEIREEILKNLNDNK